MRDNRTIYHVRQLISSLFFFHFTIMPVGIIFSINYSIIGANFSTKFGIGINIKQSRITFFFLTWFISKNKNKKRERILRLEKVR